MRRGDVVTTLLTLTSLALSPTASAARGADNAAPVITHVAPGACPVAVAGGAAVACVIEATIVDASGVFDPTLLVRLRGVTAYERVAMKAVDGQANHYAAVVPAALSVAGDVEYLIEAFDLQGNGPARAGDEAAPLVLLEPVAPVNVTAPVEPVVVVEEEGNGLVLGMAVAVGVIAAVVIGAGTAVALYALRDPAVEEVTVSVSGPRPFAAVTP